MIEFVTSPPPTPTAGRREDRAELVRGGRTKARALDRFARDLAFPTWFGHTLDGLADLLGEAAASSADDGRPWRLVWQPSPRLARDHPEDYAALVEVLADVAAAPDRSVTVVGPRPGEALPDSAP